MISENIRDEAFSAASWQFIGQIIKLFFSFAIGILLARLLTPAEFGVVGMASVFITITYAFVDSGFGVALIQKKNCTNIDYSTVFYFNIFISIVFYILIFVFSKNIAVFFHEEQLTKMIRFLGILLIIYAFNTVQIAQLKKDLNFKIQTIVLIFSTIISGGIGIYLAYHGYGAWSLVNQAIIGQLIIVIFYWIVNKWKPELKFSFSSLKSLFAFGSRHLITSIIYYLWNNINSIVIAKFYSASTLGLYSRANRFQQISSKQISGTMAEITFPLFSNMQDNEKRLQKALKYSLRATMYISAPMTLSMFILSEVMILGLIGEKWSGSVEFLRLLCIYGLFFPIAPLLTNIINAKGRSDIFLKIEIIRKIMDIPVLAVGALVGIKEMILLMIIVMIISIIMTIIYVNRLIGYSIIDLLADTKNSFTISIIVAIILKCFLSATHNYLNNLQNFILLSAIGGGVLLLISEVFKIEEYMLIKDIILARIRNLKNNL